MDSKTQIRVAMPQDAGALLNIYAYYVENTAITFEYEVPSVQGFVDRISRTLVKYPYLIAEIEGEAVGYAYAGRERRTTGRWRHLSMYIKIKEGWELERGFMKPWKIS